MRNRIVFLVAVLSLTIGANAENKYIPAAASAPGGFGTYWKTDVRIFNPSHEHDIDVTVHFLPQGMDGTNISGRVFHVAKRATVVLDDVVALFVPPGTPSTGALRLDSDTDKSYSFVASSRTYTQSGDVTRPGTYGQFIPAYTAGTALKETVLLHVTSRLEARTNVGVMNPGSEPATVTMKLVGIDGVTYLTSDPQEIPPKSMRQWSVSDLFGGLFVTDSTVSVSSTLPVFTYASVVDNASGDAIYVTGVEDRAIVTPLEN
jgi:DNA polymerase III delta prime subunit